MECISKVHETGELAKVLNKDYGFIAIYDEENSDLKIFMIDDSGERVQISQDEFNREFRRLKREFEFSEGIMSRSNQSKSNPSTLERSQTLVHTTAIRTERQKKIKQVLASTKKRVEVLEGYLRALDEKGIH